LAIETPVQKIHLFPVPDFHLLSTLGVVDINPRFSETTDVLLVSPLIHNLEDTVSLVQAFPDEGEGEPVLFLPAVNKSPDMMIAAERRAGQPDVLRVDRESPPVPGPADAGRSPTRAFGHQGVQPLIFV
jgi:hypothetical protein